MEETKEQRFWKEVLKGNVSDNEKKVVDLYKAEVSNKEKENSNEQE